MNFTLLNYFVETRSSTLEAVPMHQREVVFEPYDAQAQRESGSEPVLLRCRKELSEGQESNWYAQTITSATFYTLKFV